MNPVAEKLIKEYPKLKREQKCLAYQLASFRGLSQEDVIESLHTPCHDGACVKSSNISDKTAQVALIYQDKTQQLNEGWYKRLGVSLKSLTEELVVFESALRALSGELSMVMWDMVVEQLKWDAVEIKYAISRTSLHRMRQKAMTELDELYEKHDRKLIAYLLE